MCCLENLYSLYHRRLFLQLWVQSVYVPQVDIWILNISIFCCFVTKAASKWINYPSILMALSHLCLWTHNSIHNWSWAAKSRNVIWQFSISWLSPVCVWQLWEQLLSPMLPHLCNCSQSNRAPLYLCHIPSRSCTPRHVRSTMSETAQTRTFPQMKGGQRCWSHCVSKLLQRFSHCDSSRGKNGGGVSLVFETHGGCCLLENRSVDQQLERTASRFIGD